MSSYIVSQYNHTLRKVLKKVSEGWILNVTSATEAWSLIWGSERLTECVDLSQGEAARAAQPMAQDAAQI